MDQTLAAYTSNHEQMFERLILCALQLNFYMYSSLYVTDRDPHRQRDHQFYPKLRLLLRIRRHRC